MQVVAELDTMSDVRMYLPGELIVVQESMLVAARASYEARSDPAARKCVCSSVSRVPCYLEQNKGE